MRGLLALLALVAVPACAPSAPPENWSCNYDADVSRPLADQDAAFDEDGSLSSDECATTCGPPVFTCTRTLLDGGRAGAICPVCTF